MTFSNTFPKRKCLDLEYDFIEMRPIGQTNAWTDPWTDRHGETDIPASQLRWAAGIMMTEIYNTIWFGQNELTHWGRLTHICVSILTIIGSDNGLSPHRRQAIIWTNAGLLLIGCLGTNYSEILIEILTFLFKKMRLKVSSAKRWPFCLGLNVLSCYCHLLWHGLVPKR